MDEEYNFNHQLTRDDIQIELDKIGEFFAQIPEDLKADTAENFIFEIVNWASRDHYQALGIFQEAELRYREIAIQIAKESAEEDDENDYDENDCDKNDCDENDTD